MNTQQDPPALPDKAPASAGAGHAWQRVLIAFLIASAMFFVLFVVASALPFLVFGSTLVFLPVGIWLGRGSHCPWLDGVVYGLLSALSVGLILSISGFPMGTRNLLYALLLALPQGVLGTFLGTRLPFRSGASS